MSKRNGTPPEPTRADRLKPGGGITPEAEEWLERRSAAFRTFTQRKGMPLTFGTGVKPEPKRTRRK